MAHTLRIFWPTDVTELERQTEYQPSVVIGWRNGRYDYVVITTLPFLDLETVDSLLLRDDLLSGSKHPSWNVYKQCGQKRLAVLGTLNCPDITSTRLLFKATLDENHAYPVHTLMQGTNRPIQVIAFDPPKYKKMQYFSVSPISFELSDKKENVGIDEEYESMLASEAERDRLLIDNIYQHTGTTSNKREKENSKILSNIISQLNCCDEMGELMRKNAAIAFPKLRARPRRLSVGQSALMSAQKIENRVSGVIGVTWNIIYPFILWVFVSLVLLIRLIAELVLRIIEWKPAPGFAALKDILATAQQIHLRLQQFCYWPMQYMTIRKRSENWASNTDFNVEYIRYYNSIWLVANDVIIGAMFGRIVLENKDLIVSGLVYLTEDVLTTRFQENMLWLMDWPGGLKLNNELAAFFGELVLWVVHIWNGFLLLCRPYFGTVVTVIGYSGYAGVTLSISLISDCISLLTFHVYSFYMSSARIYHWQLTVLKSLFHLFRGKKHNVLRNRIDSVRYDLDQLLMGTIFFTVMLFLLPTVLVFYLFFAFGRLSTILACAILEFALMGLNHFPLFAILLRLKDSRRIPGGISIKVVNGNRKPNIWTSFQSKTDIETLDNGQSFVQLRSIPLSFEKMFQQYFTVSQRLKFYYFSGGMIKRILTGQFIPIQRNKLYGPLYFVLPDKRAGVYELYNELNKLRKGH